MITIAEITWLAGLLEGEGCFYFRSSPAISLQMTDRDIIEKATSLVNNKKGKNIYSYKPKGNRKRAYSLRIHGYRAIAWMLTIYSFMGERRKEKIRNVISDWKKSNYFSKGTGEFKIYALCHPTRLRYFKMMCHECCRRRYNDKAAAKARTKRTTRIRCTATIDLFK